MKLKLDTQEDTTILTVTGPITADHVPVLKAGLLKFSQSGKEQIILDLTAVRERDLESPAVLQELDALSKWASENDFDLLVASLVQNLGDVPSPAHALAIYESPAVDLLLQECVLKAEVRRLRDRRTQLEIKLERLKGEAVAVRSLKKENSDLRSVIQSLEHQVFKLIERRAQAPQPRSEKADRLGRTILPVLQQFGLVRMPNE